MRYQYLFCTIISGLLIISGCGSSESPSADSNQNNQSPTNTSTASSNSNDNSASEEVIPYIKEIPPPETVAEAFLKATSEGNNEKAAAQLTTIAREKQKIKESLPQSKTAVIEVIATEFPTEYPKNKFGDHAGAHVLCKWSEQNAAGKVETIDVICLLKREPDSWRIQGMVIKFPQLGGQTVAFDFENPKEMYQKIDQIGQDIQQTEAATKVAKQPNRKQDTKQQ